MHLVFRFSLEETDISWNVVVRILSDVPLSQTEDSVLIDMDNQLAFSHRTFLHRIRRASGQ